MRKHIVALVAAGVSIASSAFASINYTNNTEIPQTIYYGHSGGHIIEGSELVVVESNYYTWYYGYFSWSGGYFDHSYGFFNVAYSLSLFEIDATAELELKSETVQPGATVTYTDHETLTDTFDFNYDSVNPIFAGPGLVTYMSGDWFYNQTVGAVTTQVARHEIKFAVDYWYLL